jgi:hypothetical protein
MCVDEGRRKVGVNLEGQAYTNFTNFHENWKSFTAVASSANMQAMPAQFQHPTPGSFVYLAKWQDTQTCIITC